MKTPSLFAMSSLLAATTWIFSACASSPPPSELLGRSPAVGEEVFYPAPPDTTRIQFLLALTNRGDVDGRGDGGARILKPYGIAFRDGRMFVCDSDLRGVVVLDLDERVFRRFLPTGLGSLRTPVNCTVDPENGDLYVTDGERHDVTVFDSTLALVATISADGGRAVDVFVDGDTLWISDMERHVVDVYEKSSRTLVRSITGGEAETFEKIRQPTNIWVTDRHLYVSDFGDFVVKVYDRSGTYLRSVGSFGRSLGQFVRPKGIAVDSEDRLYVVDAAFNNVQIFDHEGSLLLSFGGPYQGLGGMWLPAKITIVDDPAELARFERYVLDGYALEHILLVTNQFGPDRVGVYGLLRPEPSDTVGR